MPELVKTSGLEAPPTTMQPATAATAVAAVAPTTANAWAIAAGLLGSLGGTLLVALAPLFAVGFPWHLVIGGVVLTASSACSFVAARRFEPKALGELVTTLWSEFERHRDAQKSQPADRSK